MFSILDVVTLALSACSGALVFIVVVRRLQLARAERARQASEERVRGLALAVVAGEIVQIPPLGERDAHELAALIRRYARHLEGDVLQAIAAYFERGGHVEHALQALVSRSAWRRADAAGFLGDAFATRAEPSLRAATGDKDPAVRAASVRSLGRLRSAAAVPQLARLLIAEPDARNVITQALVSIGVAALPAVRLLTEHPDPDLRAIAVELVGLLGDGSDGALLTTALRDSAAEVRAKAARALGRLGADQAASDLRLALRDRIPFVRTNVAHALAALGDREAVADLITQARSDDYAPAQAAAIAVGRIDAKALEQAAARERPPSHLLEAADLLLITT